MTAFSRGMTYSTPKFAMIYDYRLALLNYALKFVIFIYVIAQLWLKKTFLKMEIPRGSLTNKPVTGTTYLPVQAASQNQATPGRQVFGNVTADVLPCAGPMDDYNFELDAATKYENVQCAYYQADELIRKEPAGGIFITTHMQETVTYRSVSDGACRATHKFVDGTDVELSDESPAGGCFYKKSFEWIAVGAEHISVSINHMVNHGAKKQNPKTFVRLAGFETNLKVIEEGDNIQLSVAEILNLTDIVLDARNDNYDNGYGADAGRKPVPRLAGLQIGMHIKYYNYNLENKNSLSIGTKGIQAVLVISPSYSWTTQGHQITYRSERGNLNDPINMKSGRPEGYMLDSYPHGINFEVTSSGSVGQFDFWTLLNTLIAGFVLFSVSNVVCDLVARFGLGGKSKIYNRAIFEEVDFRRAAAKFAIQGMLSNDQYKRLDSSTADDGISLEELHQRLVDTYCGTSGIGDSFNAAKDWMLTEEECRVLAMFIMQAGDREARERFLTGMPRASVEELDQRSLDMPEWTNLFTGGMMDVKLIKDCIKDEVQNNKEEMNETDKVWTSVIDD